ncbi:T9SS type A sorting domain-containing protein [Hyunsoonleella sp. SJ7]|uniref:T9SS type A sorting domain-containing protein n=1 Tax=Hyunsoonleella aquatilis TaxID=2762758 RepID=A0A923KIU3_9FLAO|nr:T9SS type A sorting domain-containing protein [Hyunsoonleella aquatilis]MBC3759204.1 T9SS type A sorting domain-containing protein [Hyunsoonleella aquatilis]
MGKNKSTSNFKNLVFTLAIVLVLNNSLTAQVYPFSDPSNTGGWVLNAGMSDEFEALVLDETKWLIQGKNGEYQSNFVGRPPSQFSTDNVRLEDGKLKIQTRWEPDYPFSPTTHPETGEAYENITTAAVITKQVFKFGYMETKCKAANAPVTSSFWTTNATTVATSERSELDMFEMFGGHKTNASWRKRLKFNIISWAPDNPYYLPDGNGPVHTRNIQADNETASGFHVYGFEWTPDYIKVYIDGVLHPQGTITKAELTQNGEDSDRWVTDVPYHIWFDSETFPWLGLPEAADLPADYEIEYLRVWQTNQISVQATADAAEPSTNGAFKVSLPNGTLATQDITVNYNVTGTATADTDYNALSGSVTILNGNNSASIPVNVIGDNDLEGDESVIVTLTSTSSGVVNTTPAEITIADTATILTAGDIAIVGWKAEGNNGGAVAFMLLKDIVSGTKMSFSNRSWKGTQDGWTGDFGIDDVWTWTAGASHAIGDIFILDSDGQVKQVSADVESAVGTTSHDVAGKIVSSDDDADFDLSSSGDSVLIYQVYGTFSEPTDPNASNWITGINLNGGWGTGGGNVFCALPTALSNGNNANTVGTDQNYGVYKEKLMGSVGTLRSTINNSSNWVFNEDTNYRLWSHSETVSGDFGDIGISGTLTANDEFHKPLMIYPNPVRQSSSKIITISSPNTSQISVYNISGVKVIEQKKETESLELPLGNLAPGVYFMTLGSNTNMTTKKIIIE